MARNAPASSASLVATPSLSSSSSSPASYFFQSPYLSKELDACLRLRSRVDSLASRGVIRGVQRLRRGDMQCTFLVDEKQRPTVSKDNDRIFNARGNNSFLLASAAAEAHKAAAASAAATVVPVLSTPTVPL